MIPAKPSPKAVAIANRPTSSCVNEKHAMVTAWQAEPNRIVRSPPIRSASAPQAWRARKAAPSITDSMTALRVGLMPMSLQKATRCAEGTDIGMQQKKAAMQSSACATLGGKPATSRPAFAAAAFACCDKGGAMGAGRNSRVAGRMTASTTPA